MLKELHSLHSLDAIEAFINDHALAFLYVSRESCSVCHAVLPKLRELLEKFPDIRLGHIDAEDVAEVASRFLVFTVPIMMLFVNGKEYVREDRFVQLRQLEDRLTRVYQEYRS
ncbi:thioredoxin [Paenibacillus sp. JCM 10914]|nr:thioredoxin [Paenibacillus sp. JCM 10914]